MVNKYKELNLCKFLFIKRIFFYLLYREQNGSSIKPLFKSLKPVKFIKTSNIELPNKQNVCKLIHPCSKSWLIFFKKLNFKSNTEK